MFFDNVIAMRYNKLIEGKIEICDNNEESVCIEYVNKGYRYWLRNHTYHNREGPAIERDIRYGHIYWLNGESYTYDEWKIEREIL